MATKKRSRSSSESSKPKNRKPVPAPSKRGRASSFRAPKPKKTKAVKVRARSRAAKRGWATRREREARELLELERKRAQQSAKKARIRRAKAAERDVERVEEETGEPQSVDDVIKRYKEMVSDVQKSVEKMVSERAKKEKRHKRSPITKLVQRAKKRGVIKELTVQSQYLHDLDGEYVKGEEVYVDLSMLLRGPGDALEAVYKIDKMTAPMTSRGAWLCVFSFAAVGNRLVGKSGHKLEPKIDRDFQGEGFESTGNQPTRELMLERAEDVLTAEAEAAGAETEVFILWARVTTFEPKSEEEIKVWREERQG